MTASSPAPDHHRHAPDTFETFAGQHDAVDLLSVAVKSARVRDVPLGHVLLSGPPGLGKTTLGYRVLPTEMGCSAQYLNCAAIERPVELLRVLSCTPERSILFLDEAHSLPPGAMDHLLSVMEDRRLTVMIGEDDDRKPITVDLPPFTIVAATTRPGDLSQPLLDRFRHHARLELYSPFEMEQVIRFVCRSRSIELTQEGADLLIGPCQGTARKVTMLIDAIVDTVTAAGQYQAGVVVRVTVEPVRETLRRLGYAGSLAAIQQRYLACLRPGPASIATIAAQLGDTVSSIELTVEPWLVGQGLVTKTSRGRSLTRKGMILSNNQQT